MTREAVRRDPRAQPPNDSDPRPQVAATARAPSRGSILLLAPKPDLTFVANDVRILSRSHDVDVVSRHDHATPRRLIAAMLRRLVSRRYELVYIWFAEPLDAPYIAVLARLLRVRSVLVVGGYELAAIPELGYGSLDSSRNRRRLRLALRTADLVLPTSHLLANEARLLGEPRRLQVIHPGIDCTLFSPGGGDKEPLVVTVASIKPDTIRLKGLDVFAECSRLLPDLEFAILGPALDDRSASDLRARGGANLRIPGDRLSPCELAQWYRRARVYAQLSARESFGVAIAEAMACACVPVATCVGSLPEVVADAGFFAQPGDPGSAVRAIRRAAESGPLASAAARERVVACFPQERRERDLSAVIAALLRRPG